MKENRVKQALRSGGVAMGVMCLEFATTGIGPLSAAAGAEVAVFDMEHTGWSTDTIRMLVSTARGSDLLPFVRVPATQYHLISVPLFTGVIGRYRDALGSKGDKSTGEKTITIRETGASPETIDLNEPTEPAAAETTMVSPGRGCAMSNRPTYAVRPPLRLSGQRKAESGASSPGSGATPMSSGRATL